MLATAINVAKYIGGVYVAGVYHCASLYYAGKPIPGWAVVGWPVYAVFCFWDSFTKWKNNRKQT